MTRRVRAPKSSLFVLLAACGLHCSSSDRSDDELLGRAQIALTQAPADARCMTLTVTGSRIVSANFDLTPGQGAILNMDSLPLGNDVFGGFVYPVGCSSVTGSTVPSWKAVPTTVNVQPDVVNAVSLTLQANGIAAVCLNFEGLDATSDACPPPDASFIDARPADAAVDAGADRDSSSPSDASVDAPRDAVAEAEAAASCSAGQVLCSGSCVNPQTSQQFCGATAGCGVDGGTAGLACTPVAQACISGVCTSCTGFGPAAPIPTQGGTTFDLVALDLNGDGRADIATANQASGDVSVLLGNGIGFGPPVRIPAGPTPSGIVAPDLNGDGRPDLVVSNNGPNTLSILNSGPTPGTFNPPITIPVGTGPLGLATGDFNKDGRPDVALVAQGSGTLALFFGAAGGSLTNGPGIPAGTSPRTVTVADLNADGNLDFLVANASSNDVTVVLGTAAGTFGTRTTIVANGSAQQVAAGDFNGDGRADLAIASTIDVRVMFGNGSGTTFTPGPTLPPAGTSPTSVAARDIDGDGRLDLVISNQGSNNVIVFLGNGTGTFVQAFNLPLPASPRIAVLADFNGDGKSDIATANPTANNASVVLSSKPAGCP